MEDRFNKKQILKSKRYAESRDILSAFLDEDKSYTFEEIDNVINEFNSKEFVMEEAR